MEVMKKMSKINRKIQNQQLIRQSSKVFELMQHEEEELKRNDSQINDEDNFDQQESDRHSKNYSRRLLLPNPSTEVV